MSGLFFRKAVFFGCMILFLSYADESMIIASDSLCNGFVNEMILTEANKQPRNEQAYDGVKDTSISQLQKIVITSGRRMRRFESNRSLLIIGPQEWIGTNKSVADVLAEHTGIQTRKYGGMGSFQTVSIRGVKGSEILVLLDGVPLNSAMGGAVDLGAINPIHLQEIEVYKGVVSSMMGGNSLGGVINLKTKPVTKKSSFDLSTEIGSFGKQRITSGVSKGFNSDLFLYGAVSFGHCENNFPYLDRNNTLWGTSTDPRNDDTIRTLKNAQFRSFDCTIHPTVIIPQLKKRVVSNIYFSDIIRHVPAQETKENETARYCEKKVVASFSLQNEDSTRFQLTPRIGYVFTDGLTEWHGSKKDQGFGSSHGETVGYTSSGMAENSLDGKLEMKYYPCSTLQLQGLFYCQAGDAHPRYARGDAMHGDWHSRRALGGVAADVTALAGLFAFATGGNFSGVYDETDGGVDVVSSKVIKSSDTITLLWNAEAGISFTPFEKLKLYVNGGRYSNQPSLRERFGAKGAVMANPELKTEYVKNAEAGLKFNSRWLFLECSAFYIRCKNTIEFSSDGYLTKPVNNEGSRIYGLEFSSMIDLTKYVSVDLSSTWQKSKNLDITYRRKTRMMPDEPECSINSSLKVKPLAGISLSYSFGFKSLYYHDLANTDSYRVPAFVTTSSKEYGSFSNDLLLVWKVNRNFDIKVSVEDIYFGKNHSMANSIEKGYGTVVTPATWWNFAAGYSF
ncbi:MAG: TonB-dependent receptor [Chitinispirillaceae bacterium]|nr:TonB-dependent receptor [Chitinispirillaceae bacterium]